jgi:hypothetical protein
MYRDCKVLRLELIPTHFVKPRKKLEHKINKLTAQNQSQISQNTADIHYVLSQHFSRLSE